ncbi:serine/threonine protein phosphatase, partial [Streptomyces sp. NPDC059233]
MTEYPTSQEGPQPVASGGGTDEPGHGKAPIAAEAVRTHAPDSGAGLADSAAAAAATDARAARSAAGGGGLPHPRGEAGAAARNAAGDAADEQPRTRGEGDAPAGDGPARARDGDAARNAGRAPGPRGEDGDDTAGGGKGGMPGGEVTAARREGDRLRFVGAATRRIARGIDLDEIVLGLCRATVPTFSDAILVYLRDPLPVGDERPVGQVVLRLRRTDRLRPIDD